MTARPPIARILLDYRTVYGSEPPEDRLLLIKSVSKKSVLFELAALNHRLKPSNKIYYDNSIETQKRELTYFTKDQKQYLKYSRIAAKHTRGKNDHPLIFNRAACLFAMEEIINSD